MLSESFGTIADARESYFKSDFCYGHVAVSKKLAALMESVANQVINRRVVKIFLEECSAGAFADSSDVGNIL